MKAGRELDALVAEKVMGWQRMTYAQIYSHRDPGSHGYGNDHRLTLYWHSAQISQNGTNCEMALAEDSLDYYSPESVWSPSTDIAAAWEVVEKLPISIRGHGNPHPHFTIQRSYGSWTAGYETGWGIALGTTVLAESAPHAICLAALKAVGVDVSQIKIAVDSIAKIVEEIEKL